MMQDLVVIGGGVMGLFCAYEASLGGARVVVLEAGRVGDPATASFARTRSYRSDYLDPVYVRFAREALALWEAFEAATGRSVLVRCGCMNIAKRVVTPAGSYAQASHLVLCELGVPVEAVDGDALRARYPMLDADVGRIDLEGGVVDVRAVTDALRDALTARGVRIVEGACVSGVARLPEGVVVETDAGGWRARAVVVTAGHGTNDVLARLEGVSLRVPITRDRPVEAWYYAPPGELRDHFTADAMPVIAYLDVGIYCHPIVPGVVDWVKIGYYHPPDVSRSVSAIDSVAAFVEHCMPGLRDAQAEPVADVDGCDYDLVADDEFVLGPVPGFPGAHVGVGWRGTGYKFAPWVGRVLAQLSLQRGTVYDIGRFDPARFTKGGADAGASVAAQPVPASA